MEYRGLVIDCIDDCNENAGGYFCEVHRADVLDDRIDYFCIHPEDLSENPDVEFWMREYIDSAYSDYVAQGFVPSQTMQQTM